MYTKDVFCDTPECERAAAYKIAAPWSTGSFTELKCYGLACADHVSESLQSARQRASSISHSPGEKVGEIGVYGYVRGKHDKELERLKAMEE